MADDSNREKVAVHAVILAGGSGTRLWPLSRLQLPKQFLRLKGEHTLLEDTIQRLAPIITSDQVLIVTGAEHASGEAYNSLKSYQTLLEPVGRNTAPAIALAAAWLSHLEPEDDPVMVVLPADHIINNVTAFHAALNQAIDSASSRKLVTFGIQPTRPDTGFGYIKAGEGSDGSLPVEHFAEKPDLETAQQFLNEGSYYWNSGMFVWRCSTILDEIRLHLPELHEGIGRIRTAWEQGTSCQTAIDDFFPAVESISIDYGVLEKSDRVALVPCDMDWSDVGSWDAVYEIAQKDPAGNSLQGNVLVDECRNTLVHSNKRLVAAVGVEDLCIIETADAVLVAKRGETQRVRNIVDSLKQNNAQEHLVHLTVQRPWGRYTVLEEQAGYKMKRITVEPGGQLSLQSHQHRSEHWIVVSGTATVTRGEASFTVTKNQSTYIPIGEKHRLENLGKIPLEMIEVQVGEYLNEDDIERFDDNYGRD